jgi:endonuclease YncB( thermonuclease family)
LRFLVALFALVVLNAQAESFEAKVLAVMDGDTVFVKSGAFKAKLRLVNVDAPEKDQPFGKESQESLQSLIGGKVIHVESKAMDKFGRTIGLISIGDINVNEEQVRRGMAWAYSRSREGRAYARLQSEAQQAKRGLWQQANPQSPAQWRKLHPSEPAKHARQQQHKALPQTQKPERFSNLACGKKSYCSQMVTCDEAHFYLTVCGVKRLDTNKDGIPCESLCGVLE